MEINWFTVIAQILNFFLLVWLLKKFLYKPILDAINKRENNIRAQLEDAEAKKAEALTEQEAFKQKNLTFDEEKKDLMDKVIATSKEVSTKLMETARTEAEALKTRLGEAEKEKQKNRDGALAHHIQQEVFAISRKALSYIATSSLEEQVTSVFIQRLIALKGNELNEFKNAFKRNEITLRSAFPLPEAQQNQIEKLANELLDTKVKLIIEVAPELIGGIELATKEYKLSWSISGYLNSLEEQVLEKNSNPFIS